MRRLKRILALTLALCLCAGLLCGCNQEEDAQKLTFRAALSGAPVTLDPAMATTATEKTVDMHLFENLMKLTADGVVCGQAKSYTCTDNVDGTQTYVFTLRDNIHWSDGVRVTAEDYAFSWMRLLDPDLKSPNAALLDTVMGYDKAIEGDLNALQVWADEEGRFVVVLSEKDPYFLNTVCTAVATMPVRSDAVENDNWSMSKSTLRTNGAFGLRQWSGNKMTLVEIEDYYDAKRPGPEQIQITFAETEDLAKKLFDEGQVDFAMGANHAEDATEITLPTVGVLVVNQMASTLSREVVRQAMSQVIDRNAIADSLGVDYVAADGIIPQGITTLAGGSFREANGPVIDNNPEDAQANLTAAQENMQRAGYSTRSGSAGTTLEKITLLFESNPANLRTATMLQTQWKERLNINVILQGVAVDQIKDTLKDGEFTMALITITTDRNDASSLLRAWQSTDSRNYGQYYSSAYEMLLNVAAKSDSVEAHDAYLEDAERLLVESGYAMPIYMKTGSYALQSNMLGLYGDGMGTYCFAGITVAPTA